MRSKRDETAWLPTSRHYDSVKDTLDKVEKKLAEDKEVNKDKKANYVRVIREMNYTMGKCDGFWPSEVDKVIDNLGSILN